MSWTPSGGGIVPEYTFYNVTITIDAPTAYAAYYELCTVFAESKTMRENRLEYTTCTFSREDSDTDRQLETSRLFPESSNPYLK